MAFVWTALVLAFLHGINAFDFGQEDQSSAIFNVKHYGAVADGQYVNTREFLEAWEDACNFNGGSSILLIPNGVYRLDSIIFSGPCRGSITFLLNGVVKPPAYTKSSEFWFNFRYVDWLHITGEGILDGEGHRVWGKRGLPATMTLDFVNNARISNIRSVNSRNAHFSLFTCENVEFANLTIRAPYNSPNTDGIKLGASSHIRIRHTAIGTGDDCVAIISGTRDVDISNLKCGPGHGISVGSLGEYADGRADVVMGVSVRSSLFVGTQNGLRIKTWGSHVSGLASNLTYQNIQMVDVQNPIIIDQNYCPYPPCSQVPSHIQIKDVRFQHIWGTTTTKVAVAFSCSKYLPCKNVVTRNINLAFHGVGGPATSLCSNVIGEHYGVQIPPPCL